MTCLSMVSIVYTDPNKGSALVTRRLPGGRMETRIVYSRDFILATSASPFALIPPVEMRTIVLNYIEVVASVPTSFYNRIRVGHYV
ncbi:hypothetical protein Tcan_01980 [Toxocara canis]|uniref:Uncharacterized protein n=1 Tax=Toxocara canis TaxID=6265 RepID=A0A0B2VXN6_TOXCA|nr:hypothetical protein Tcan_01980 [Toxocara canis]